MYQEEYMYKHNYKTHKKWYETIFVYNFNEICLFTF